MSFGLKNALATFQSIMNEVLLPYLQTFVLVFDDILIYSSSLEDHLTNLEIVLELLKENQLVANFKKCQFTVERIEYLGDIILAEGVTTELIVIDLNRD